MAFLLLKPLEPGGKLRPITLPDAQAARFKAILDGKAIPTPFEKQKAAKIAKIYLSKHQTYPQELEPNYRKPYRED